MKTKVNSRSYWCSVKRGIRFAITVAACHSYAFSLMGPYADWMCQTNGFRLPGDIGGAMEIHEEYRWNVPVLTYGFDKVFADYFGSNGVAVVESAIQVFNDLPPASGIILSNYALNSQRLNYVAQGQGLYDLKSATMALLLEQMGLAPPTRNIFGMRRWTAAFKDFCPDSTCWDSWVIPDFIVMRNFDPLTLLASRQVNGTWYEGLATSYRGQNDATEYRVDPLALAYSAVADYESSHAPGVCYNGFSRDDVGGLRYLLSTNNINFEYLLPGVHGSGSNSLAWVNGAWRPGVEKITFVRQPVDLITGLYAATNIAFIDTFVTNGVEFRQQLARTVAEPDILFSVGDTGEKKPGTIFCERTGTAQWTNLAAMNGGATNAGPGVIQPPVRILFHKLGGYCRSDDSLPASFYDSRWGSFDGSTNPPVAYPVDGQKDLTVRLRLWSSDFVQTGNFTWQLPVPMGELATLQVSTNFSNWVTVGTVTNAGAVVEWRHVWSLSPFRAFRVVAP